MNVSILIVTWNSAATIGACLTSLPERAEIIVVDNASSDDTRERVLSARPSVTYIQAPTNLGFGAACNLAARSATGDAYLLLNPDALLPEEAYKRLCDMLDAHATWGAIGPRLFDQEGGVELSWGKAPSILAEWKRQAEHKGKLAPSYPTERSMVDWVSGACMLIRAAAWQTVEGFDEGYFLYFEDVDLCRRLKAAGWDIVYDPDSEAHHLRGHSAQQVARQVEIWYRDGQMRYYARHNALHQRAALMLFLVGKYGIRALRGDEPARAILRSLWRGRALHAIPR